MRRTCIRRSTRLSALGAAVAVLLFLGTASAQTINFTMSLDGSQEVPPSGSPGTGSGTATLNTTTNVFKWNFSWSGLLATETAAHFHGPAAAGSNAPVVLNVGTSNPNTGSMTLTAQQAADLQNDLWYANVHSVGFGGGEIRGQVINQGISAIPTMSEWGLIIMGALTLGVAVVVLRKRRVGYAT